MNPEENTPPASPLGERRAQWREQHICLRCDHYAVCKMAAALDPNFLVVISHCLAFEPVGDGDSPRRRERR